MMVVLQIHRLSQSCQSCLSRLQSIEGMACPGKAVEHRDASESDGQAQLCCPCASVAEPSVLLRYVPLTVSCSLTNYWTL